MNEETEHEHAGEGEEPLSSNAGGEAAAPEAQPLEGGTPAETPESQDAPAEGEQTHLFGGTADASEAAPPPAESAAPSEPTAADAPDEAAAPLEAEAPDETALAADAAEEEEESASAKTERSAEAIAAQWSSEETETAPEVSPTLDAVFGREEEPARSEAPAPAPSWPSAEDEPDATSPAGSAPAGQLAPGERVMIEEEETFIKDDGIDRRWYALHAYSGQEASVRRNLLTAAEHAGLDDHIGGVLVPMEKVAEMKGGEKKVSKRKFFPGYVLVQLTPNPEKNPELWHLIHETPGVSGFIGPRRKPAPLSDTEVNAIIEELRGERERPKPKMDFDVGERVKIIDGPFANFLGNIDSIDHERGKLKVLIEVFERLTSVEVDHWQIEKM